MKRWRFYSTTIIFLLIFAVSTPALAKEPFNVSPPYSKKTVIELSDGFTSTVEIVELNRPFLPESSEEDFPPSLEVKFGKSRNTIPISDIRALHFRPEKRLTYVSDEKHTRLFATEKLSSDENAPPWHSLEYDHDKWERPVRAHPNYRWFYIPGAMWVWRDTDNIHPRTRNLLVRRTFEAPPGATCRRAILYITVDSNLLGLWINGEHLEIMPRELTRTYLALDITSFIKSGENLLCMSVAKSGSGGFSFAGFAYRLDLYMTSTSGTEGALLPSCPVVAYLENGDIVSGNLEDLTNRWLELQTPFGTLKIDRDWIRNIRMNYQKPPEDNNKPGLFKRILGIGDGDGLFTRKEYPHFTLQLHPEEMRNQVGFLLKSGEFINGRILGKENSDIIIKPRYGPDFPIHAGEIDTIYLNLPGRKNFIRYPPRQRAWVCNVHLLNNSGISGLIFDITPEETIIKPPYCEEIRIKNKDILRCVFPFVELTKIRKETALFPDKYPSRIAIIGERNPSGPPYEDTTYCRVQFLLSEMGMEGNLLEPEQMINDSKFNPANYPLLLNLDEMESYYRTVEYPLDAFSSLVTYFKKGGSLAHLAVGAPFYYGTDRNNSQWVKNSGPPKINSILNMNIVIPGEAYDNARAFELPDTRKAGMLYFERNKTTPLSDRLPDRIDFPFIGDTRFRPIVPDETTTRTIFTPIYYLKSSNGRNLGTAMAVLDYLETDEFEANRCFYANHLLFNSEYLEESMLNYLVPRIIDLAVTPEKGRISDQ